GHGGGGGARRERDFASAAGSRTIDARLADEALNRLDVDARGLDAMDRRYLAMIAEKHGGGPVGVETLAAALSEQRDVLEEVIEPFLIQQGLMARTGRGRMLTLPGYGYLGLQAPKSAAQMELLAATSEEGP
ncbi:MAG: Holliday junction DNA helicase RuvB C-terminal domain-containing protein, partial [Kiloniellales bacterium]